MSIGFIHYVYTCVLSAGIMVEWFVYPINFGAKFWMIASSFIHPRIDNIEDIFMATMANFADQFFFYFFEIYWRSIFNLHAVNPHLS